MNVRSTLTLAFLALLLGSSMAREPAAENRITFHNGDTLTGKLTGLDTATGRLQWAYPGSPSPFAFDLETVSHVILRQSLAPLTHSQPFFKITLTNGNTLFGAIVALDDQTLTLDAGLETALTIPRQHVHRLDAALNASQLLYQGPVRAGEWEVGYRGKNWQFENGHLISESYSSTGRELTIPDRARIELDASLREDPTLNIFLCADNPRNGGDSYYYLQLTPNFINFQRYWRDHPRTYINLVREYENKEAESLFLGQDQVHLAVEIDRPARELKLFINGELYAHFRDPAPKAPAGSSMILASYGNGAVRAKAIRVYALDRLTSTQNALESGTTVLRNGESFSEILAIANEKLHAGRRSASLDQLLGASLSERVFLTEPSTLRLFLASGGRLDGEVRLDGENVSLEHALLGDLSLPLTMIDGFLGKMPDKEPSPSGSRVLFKNGDRLAGRLHGWDDSNGLAWQWAGQEPPLFFPRHAVAEVHLTPDQPLPPAKTMAHLAGGDALPGQVLELSPTELIFDTAFSETMSIPFAAVRKLDFSNPENVVFRGPGALQDWQIIGTDADWTRDADGALVGRGPGGVSRPLPMPERGRLDIELSWTGQLDTSITLFARELDRPIQPGSYRLHCENQRIALYRGLSAEEVTQAQEEEDPLRNRRLTEQLERFSAEFGGGSSRRLGSPVAVPFQTFRRQRVITLCWDQAQASLSLLVDGRSLHTWEDPDGLVPPANGFILQQHHRSSVLRVAAMKLRAWNGILPEPSLSDKAARALTKTVVRLRNQDEFLAQPLHIANPQAPLTFTSDLGELALPTSRLEFLQFPEADYPVEHQLGMVLDGHLEPEGFSRFFLTKIAEGQVIVSSPYFGENVFNLGVFRKLVFDLQDRAFWDGRSAPWPHPLPVSMRPEVQKRQSSREKARKTPGTDTSKYNESVEFDE